MAVIELPIVIALLLIGLIVVEAAAIWWLYQGKVQATRSGQVSEAAEDLLKELYDLVPQGQAIGAQRLADTTQREPAAVSNLVDSLKRAGWVTQQSGGDIQLTEAGRSRALQLTRAHRLWERYLAEEGTPLEEVHVKAHRKEHVLTAEEADRLDEQLGFPARDPHGDPIPDRDGVMRETIGEPLTAWPEGKPARVTHMEDEPPALFAQLLAMGLAPGVRLVIKRRAGGRLSIQYDGQTAFLAPAAAERIFVQEAPPDVVPLSSLGVGQTGVVVEVQEAGKTLRRMLDMGLVPGAEVEVVRAAPLGDPVQYRVKGSSISLRRREAARILVIPQDGAPVEARDEARAS
ncbi:MAG: FeoA domain-containing protein [Anaerolineae bacterium]|nr:FeoA domain-containing protein [Anaerolineae bacterium]